MAATYEPIATTTLGSNQNNVEFTGISSSFTDLILVVAARGTASSTSTGSNIIFNGITTTTYSATLLYGTGSTAASTRNSNASNIGFVEIPAATAASDLFGISIYHIMNYANTTTNKTVLIRGNNQEQVRAIVGLWRSTSAITSVRFTPTSGQVATGSTFTLYGIAAA